MSDTTLTPPTATAETPAAKAARSRGFVKQLLIDELTLSEELANTASKGTHAQALAAEEIDEAFIKAFRAKIAEADALVASAGGKTADKKGATQSEDTEKDKLLLCIGSIQARAKRKYLLGDPKREKYYIGQHIASRRSLLEAAGKAILAVLATDTLPGVTSVEVAALQVALTAYIGSKSEQSGDQSEATASRSSLEEKVREVAHVRREIQHAVDARWPAKIPANAAVRVEFKLSPDRALS